MVGNQVGLDGYREEKQFVSWKDLQSMGEGEPNSKFAGRVLYQHAGPHCHRGTRATLPVCNVMINELPAAHSTYSASRYGSRHARMYIHTVYMYNKIYRDRQWYLMIMSQSPEVTFMRRPKIGVEFQRRSDLPRPPTIKKWLRIRELNSGRPRDRREY